MHFFAFPIASQRGVEAVNTEATESSAAARRRKKKAAAEAEGSESKDKEAEMVNHGRISHRFVGNQPEILEGFQKNMFLFINIVAALHFQRIWKLSALPECTEIRYGSVFP